MESITIIGLIGYGIIAITFIIFLCILLSRNKNDEKLYNPKYAEKMERLDGITPNKGSIKCVVSPQKWVFVNWNKKNNLLEIIMAPQGWLKQEDKVIIATLNWKIVKEKKHEKITVEKYFNNTRIM